MRHGLDYPEVFVNGEAIPVDKYTLYFEPLDRKWKLYLKIRPEVLAPDMTSVHDLHDVMRAWGKNKE